MYATDSNAVMDTILDYLINIIITGDIQYLNEKNKKKTKTGKWNKTVYDWMYDVLM